MKNKKKKNALTLLEVMIVIFLIGLIGSVVGYNMKGSIDKGKAFKTERAMQQIYDILQLQIAEGASAQDVVDHPANYLKMSGMVKDPDKMIKDGWGQPFDITKKNSNDIRVYSAKLASYNKAQGKLEPVEENTEE